MNKMEKHPYGDAVEKFNGKIVEVKDVFGEIIRGLCIGIHIPHLNITIETEDSIFIIKNPQTIRREKEPHPRNIDKRNNIFKKEPATVVETKSLIVEDEPLPLEVKNKRGRPKK